MRIRPSGSSTCAEQKSPNGFDMNVNVLVTGFHVTGFDGISHASHMRISPV